MNVRNRPERWIPQATSRVRWSLTRRTATLSPTRKPAAKSACANWHERASSSPKVTVRPDELMIAGRSGWVAAYVDGE